MIISLDGWNDAVKTNFIADSNNLDLGLLNWDQLSYLYFDFYNGFDSPKPPFIFTYSYILVNYFNFMDTIKKKNRKKLYSQHHLSAQTSYLKKKYSELDFVLFKNLDAISSYSENNNIFHLIYLQPYAEKNRKLIFEEQKLLDEHHRKSVIYNGELWKRNIYKSLMEETYNNYEMYLSKFNQKYLNQNLINSFNITKIFENVDEIVYLDAIHYNFRGNEIIAKKIFEDIERILSSD